MQTLPEQAAQRDQRAQGPLIESPSGKFGCLDVTRLFCEERLALLDALALEGWELITRGVHWFNVTDQNGAVTGEEPGEYWYFKR